MRCTSSFDQDWPQEGRQEALRYAFARSAAAAGSNLVTVTFEPPGEEHDSSSCRAFGFGDLRTMEQVGLAATSDVSLWSLFMQAGFVVKLVMLGLIGASVWTWAIVVDKYAEVRQGPPPARRLRTGVLVGAVARRALPDALRSHDLRHGRDLRVLPCASGRRVSSAVPVRRSACRCVSTVPWT